ncbi:MAG TPA: putative Ig domain-containing protein [Candidatus Acidoferrum sp.]|nr:putative Ig domain-containing protein [Candidatus Acidoferrum sp.]
MMNRAFLILSLAALLGITGCSSSSPKISITLSPTSPQNANDGQVIMVTATLLHDTKVAGVTWSLVGGGALSGQTTTAVTYTAPATIAAAGTATITATSVTDPTQTATLTINLVPISVTLNPSTAQTLDQTKAVAVTATVAADSANKGVTWSINGAGTLTNVNTTTATYNAPATVTASSSPVLTATSISDNTKTATITINLVPPPSVTTASLAVGTVNVAYSATLTDSGGANPDTWSITAGTLPAGLTLDTSTGAITGMPTAAGTSNITAKVTDRYGLTATKSFTITIDQQPAITSANSATFTVNTPGTFTVTSTAFPTAALTETGSLPSGVTFVDNGNGTATLAGTATTSGSFPFTITANNGVGTAATQNFTLTVGQAPAITSGASTTFTVGAAGTFNVTTTGFPVPSLTETGVLPSGVTFVDNGNGTAKLSGTPAAATGGSYSITIKAHNGAGTDATQTFTLTVDQAPAITSAAATTFSVNTAGTFSVTTTGFPKSALTETGALPTGVTFVDNGNGTATLAGAATSSGSFPFTITASNGVVPNATQNFTLTVGQAPAITSGASTTFTVGSAGTFNVTTSGFPTPSLTETGALPSGVTFVDNGNGTAKLSGTPAAATGGIYAITIKAHNGSGADATQAFTLTVNQAPAITSAAATSFSVNAAGTFTVTTSGFPKPALSETGALPSGVTFVDNGNGTATLSGTATVQGSFPITITANNGVAPNGTQSFTLTVNTAPSFTSAATTTFTVGSAGTFSVAATGTPTPSFSETGALPSGVTLVDNHNGTATLSGTPAAGTGKTYSITITASNTSGSTNQTFTLTVDQAPAVTSPSSTSFTVGASSSFTVMTSGFPAPALSETGALPSGVTFVDNGNGTATLSGTPASGTNGSYPITITANNGVSPNGTQAFTLTVNTLPVFSSGGSTTFTVGTLGNFTVSASGSPSFTVTGTLPSGVTLTDNHNGTATLGGTPATGSGGVYNFTIKATNGTGTTSQAFALTVDEAPSITSNNTTTFAIGELGNFNVHASGFPAPTITESGTLPTGVTFSSVTSTLSGTPATGTANSYPITFTASNGIGTNATQNFTLTVVTDPCASTLTGGEALLSGQYVFVLKGFDNESPTQQPALVGGVLKFNGSGGITSGEIDTNLNAGFDTANAGSPLSVTSGTYKIGTSGSADQQRACMVVNTAAGTLHYRASLNSTGSIGHMIGFDTSGPYVTGEMKKQSGTLPTTLSGGFAFGLSSAVNTASCDNNGTTSVCGGKFAAVGQFIFSSGGTVTGGVVDFNHGDGSAAFIDGTTGVANFPASPVSITGGSYSINGTTGRGILQFDPGSGNSTGAVIYAVSSTDVLIMGSDASASNTVYAGEMLQQSASSPSGTYVGGTSRIGSTSGDTRAQLIRATLSGGNITSLTIYQNDSGTTTVQSASSAGTYTFDSTTGRIVLSVTGSNHNSVLYGVNANEAFELNASPGVESGFLQSQTSTSAPNGNYVFGTTDPATTNVGEQDGFATFSSGNVNVTQDQNTLNQQQAGKTQSPQTFSVDGTGFASVPSGCAPATSGSCQFVFYVISSTSAVGIDFGGQSPAVQPLDH